MAASLHLPADVESMSAGGDPRRCCSSSSRAASRSRAPSRRRRPCCSTCCSRSSRRRASSRSTRTISSPRRTRYWREVEQRYGTTIEVFEGPSPDELAAVHGEQLWEREARPLPRDRQGRAARPGARRTSTPGSPGIRRDQSPTRADAPKLGWDEQHELWKANPLADWTRRRRAGTTSASASCRTTRCTTAGYDSIGDTHSTQPGRGPRGPLGRHRQGRVRHPHVARPTSPASSRRAS